MRHCDCSICGSRATGYRMPALDWENLTRLLFMRKRLLRPRANIQKASQPRDGLSWPTASNAWHGCTQVDSTRQARSDAVGKACNFGARRLRPIRAVHSIAETLLSLKANGPTWSRVSPGEM